MARRRLTPAQPGYLAPLSGAALEAKAMPIAQVSGQSAEAAAVQELTQGIQSARDSGRMVVDVPLADLAQGYLLRDRIVLDRDEIEALKVSIARHGQRIPAEITPLNASAEDGAAPYRFGLISGWRRLQALSELYDETNEPRFSTLRALIRPPEDAADSYVAMIEENEIRVGLSYYERARIVSEVVRRGVFTDPSEALRMLFSAASRSKRSKIGSFIEIHDALGDVLSFPADIPERLGLALVVRLRADGPASIRDRLSSARPSSATAELALLADVINPAQTGVSRAKQTGEVLRPDVTLHLKRSGNRITANLSGAGVDDCLLEEMRRLLRQLGQQG